MSYESLARQANDYELQGRVGAGAQKEAWHNATLAATDFGTSIRQGRTNPAQWLIWPVSIDNEAAYEYAINAGNEHPGMDPTVITDGAILSAVQAAWPPDPWPPASTTPAP